MSKIKLTQRKIEKVRALIAGGEGVTTALKKAKLAAGTYYSAINRKPKAKGKKISTVVMEPKETSAAPKRAVKILFSNGTEVHITSTNIMTELANLIANAN
jgi:ribosomal protein S12